MSEERPLLRVVVVVAIAYFGLALGAIELTRLSNGVALGWLANGVLLAALGPLRPRRWPPVLAAAFGASFLATLILRNSLPAAAGFATANIVEGLIAVALLRWWGAHRRMFENVESVLMFALAGGVIAPAVGALLGGATAAAVFGLAFDRAAFDWWLGHGLGMLIAAPLAVLMVSLEVRGGWRDRRPREVAMFLGLIAGVFATTFAVFAQNALPLLFVPALPVMVATVRLGRIGAAAALVTVAVVGGALTLTGNGPIHLVKASNAFRLQFFQFYLGILFLLALPTAAMLSRQRRLTARLRASEGALRLLAEHSSDVLLSLDVDGGIRFASPSVRVLGGYEAADLLGRNALELIAPEHHALAQRAHADAIASPETNVTVEYQARRYDGEVAWFETNMRAVRGASGEVAGVVSAIRDVSHRKSVERQLQMAADTDPLTGLANRRPFEAALEAAIAAAGDRAAAVALIDLDHFKQVNDRYGHAAGDAALVTLADVCRRELRADDLIARLGGEEFGVLLRGADLTVARATCERLRLAIAAQPILTSGAPLFRVTASFGLVTVAPGARADALLAAADAALYAAKRNGRNRLSLAA